MPLMGLPGGMADIMGGLAPISGPGGVGVDLGHLLRAHGFIIVGFAEENPGLDHVSLQPVDPLWA